MNPENPCSVWAIAAQKGGVGKTTLTKNLAIMAAQAGLEVAVFDLDPQHSLADWFRDSKRHDVTARAVLRFELERKIGIVKRAGADLILIDTPPRSDEDALEAIKIADLVLIPITNEYYSHKAARATIAFAEMVKVPAHIIMNKMPYCHHIKKRADALEAAERLGLPILKTEITRSDDLEYATRAFQAVAEYAPSSRAGEELKQLFTDICNVDYNITINVDCIITDAVA